MSIRKSMPSVHVPASRSLLPRKSPMRLGLPRQSLRVGFVMGLLGGALLTGGLVQEAVACGCFAPPDPSVPVVQAGERILFAHQNGEVTAHIQVQYSGKPGEFGWLLPLPSVPKNKAGKDGIDLGVDELFSQLTATTQPKYRLTRKYDDCGNGLGGSRSTPTASAADSAGGVLNSAPPSSPLVVQDSVGPYDFAVLKADSKTEMFNWLTTNKYFIPTGTDTAVNAYIHPGGYFLALRLRAGFSTGDLQPVVLKYKSDLPMIPIILTSVAAQPNMGVQVWMLGAGRAIPRNYFHTVVNDAQINWFTAGANYNDVIIKAVGEADGKHSFVTEYAGKSDLMKNVLNRVGRFGTLDALALVKDPVSYVQGTISNGFSLNGQLTTLLSRYIPLPAALKVQGVTLASYYQRIDYYLNQDRKVSPAKYTDIEAALLAFDPAKATAELRTTIAEPTVDAGQLFDAFPYLTRLYTTLSPADMTMDPVFSYNPSLPEYSNVHEATLTYHCAGFFSKDRYSDATLVTPSGFSMRMAVSDADASNWTPPATPFSQQIQTLREVGEPMTVVDNTSLIRNVLGGGGCSLGGAAGSGSAAMLGLLGSAGLLLLRRRRQHS